MRFAYADPPYPGQAKRWYGNHPDYAGEVDHAELIARLVRDYPDGWALSTSMVALREVLPLCPADAKVAAWHKPDEARGGAAWTWTYCWEPLIVMPGRPAPEVRNVLRCSALKRFPGAKPPAFSRWLFALLGAIPTDELDDLFPGSGAVGEAWAAFQAQPALFAHTEPAPRRLRGHEVARSSVYRGLMQELDAKNPRALAQGLGGDL